mgnify:CR=1 FL=1
MKNLKRWLVSLVIVSLLLTYAVALAQAPAGQEYVVKPGDQLHAIAAQYLDDSAAYIYIVQATNAKAKEDESFTAITDPNLIEVGQRLWIPDKAEISKGYVLTILHTNDVHAHYLPFDKNGSECGEDTSQCWGGAARLATLVAELRARSVNPLLLDAGDQFQGTLFYNQYKGQDARELMNAIGYDAMTLGNHEFDSGPDLLSEFAAKVNFPIVSANLEIAPSLALAAYVKPYTVIPVGGDKIGVFGLITQDLPSLSSPGPDIKVADVAETARQMVAELEKQGVDKIIALTHIGYLADKDLAAKVDGIDIIIGGHSHTLLSNTDPAAAGPYPTVVNSPAGAPVLVITDGAYARNLGRLRVLFDDEGVVAAWEGQPIALDSSVADNAAVAEIVARLNGPLQQLKAMEVGETAVDLVGDRAVCRFAECNLGNLITDAMLVNTQQDGVQIAITNAGGIRASIAKGKISVGDVLQVLPFGNAISTFELKGEDLLAALENGVSRAENPENEGTGRFPQVAGLRFTWDPTRPVGSRIVSVEVGNARDGYAPLDPNATYKIAANNFNRMGGDDYKVFAEKAINPYDYGSLLADAVMDYIKANSPVAPEVEGRIIKQEPK